MAPFDTSFYVESLTEKGRRTAHQQVATLAAARRWAAKALDGSREVTSVVISSAVKITQHSAWRRGQRLHVMVRGGGGPLGRRGM